MSQSSIRPSKLLLLFFIFFEKEPVFSAKQEKHCTIFITSLV